jgi:serine/threonine-protein kinase RsbW
MAQYMKAVSKSNIFITEEVEPDVLKIKLRDGVDPNHIIDQLHQLFDDTFRSETSTILFDMENIQFPNASFIALLIGKTAEARRWGKSIRIIHLNEISRNHFSMFSPLTFLSFGAEGLSIVEEDVDHKKLKPEEKYVLIEGKPNYLQENATVDSLNKITDFVSILAKQTVMEKMELSKLKIAVYEACVNVIEHGYQFQPGKWIGIEVLYDRNRFEIAIMDDGESFDFYNRKNYDVQEAFDEQRRGGYGLYIIQQSVDEIQYTSNKKEGNRLTLIKYVDKK